jgi:hypothetical protein
MGTRQPTFLPPRLTLAALVLLAIGAGHAGAVARSINPSASSPAGSPPGTPASPLGGPRQPALSNPDAPPSIVRTGEMGLIERTAQPPEAIAVERLTLSEQAREKAMAVLARRANILDTFVAENLDLLTKFATAAATNDRADQLRLLSEGAGKLRPLLLDRPLAAQLRDTLPEDQTNRFGVMLEDYWDAVVGEVQATERAAAQALGEKGAAKVRSRFAIITEERLKGLGREIEAAFQRQIASGDLIYRVATRGVDLTGEQSAAIRELCREYAERTKGNASNQDNVQLFLRIASLVDVDTQVKMIRNVQAVFDSAAKPPTPPGQAPAAGPAGKAASAGPGSAPEAVAPSDKAPMKR